MTGLFSTFSLFAAGSCWLRDAASPAPSTVYALCEQGTFWITTDGGAKWASRETAAKMPLRALTFLDANRGLAIGDGGLILGTEDSGKTWQGRPSGTKEKLMDVVFVGDKGWASGMNGTMIHTGDGGRTWATQTTGTSQAIEGIFFLDPQHGWAVGFAGQILRSVDGGLTWKASDSPVHSWLTSIAFDRSNRGWITYDDGLLVSEDSGNTWKPVSVNGRFFLSRLLNMDDSLWALGQSAILRLEGTGTTWKRIESLVPSGAMREATTPQSPPAR